MMLTYKKIILLVLVCLVVNINGFAQINIANEEAKCAALYSKLLQFRGSNFDSTYFYSEAFEKTFIKLITNNPATFNHKFEKLTGRGIGFIRISPDQKLKTYSWDTWQGGTAHMFKTIRQWKANGKVYSEVSPNTPEDFGSFCSKIFTVHIRNKPHYLVITNSIFSTKYSSQTVTAYAINGNNLSKSSIFHTKTKTLHTIPVDFDFFSVVDRPERRWS
ncbi:hypothetical protein [Niabella ginsengisoli]|uniref:Uncharacterized protein n=1 Tax=Niabella ginsengisoli TaxID=522298 RepID=A0ABS9SME7_9BACT|nr:hypothetical protein [Niabella ginsengisoli]MCH5599537.1 hypothetical protein [Niabella ginsengisoli]